MYFAAGALATVAQSSISRTNFFRKLIGIRSVDEVRNVKVERFRFIPKGAEETEKAPIPQVADLFNSATKVDEVSARDVRSTSSASNFPKNLNVGKVAKKGKRRKK